MKFTPRAPQPYLRVFVIAMVTALVGAVVAACGGGGGGSGSGDANTLNVLTWETYHDPAWLDEFAKETGASRSTPSTSARRMRCSPRSRPIRISSTSPW